MTHPLQQLRASSPQWFRIARAEAEDDDSADVYLYDVIDSWFGVNANDFVRELAALDVSQINLYINSPGGSVYDGLAILNAVRRHKANVTVYVDGLAASAASFIAMGGNEIVMGRNSEMMIHDAWGICFGNAADMRELGDQLDKISDNLASIYAEKAGGDVKKWRDAMLAETWYSAEEAVAAGLADRVDEAASKDDDTGAQDRFDLSIFAHAGRRNAPAPAMPAGARGGGLAAAAQRRNETGSSEPILTQQQWDSVRAAHTPPAEPVDINTPNQEGADAMSDTLIQGLRERLGITADAKLDEDGLLAAVDEALNERAEPTEQKFTPPAGTVLLDESQLSELKAAAEEGRTARAEQVKARREATVQAAITDGRIAPARRDAWLKQLEADEEGATQVLNSLAKGTIPLAPKGLTGGVDEASDEDGLYSKAWGTPGSDKED